MVLTHHKLKDLGKRVLPLNEGDPIKLDPITESGSGMLREKEKAYLSEIIEKLNDLFGRETTDQDQLGYVQVLRTKMLESSTLSKQSAKRV